MAVIFNGTTVMWIALASMAVGVVLGGVIVNKVINLFRKQKA